MRNFIIFAASMFLLACKHVEENKIKKPEIIMAILAHPDDESALGQVLAKYAREGKKVYLVIATDGRYGVTEHAGIPAGEKLAAARKEESICAAQTLGIQSPIFLEFHDVFGLLTGIDEYFNQTKQAKEKLIAVIKQINPDIIITFGPDGDTGHLDHKGIGDLVTEVILREGLYEKYSLFFLAWPKEKQVSIPQGSMTSLNYVDKRYRNIHIKYSAEDREKLFKSLYCYKTQLTEKEVEDWINTEMKDSTFTTYFRQFTIDTTVRNEF